MREGRTARRSQVDALEHPHQLPDGCIAVSGRPAPSRRGVAGGRGDGEHDAARARQRRSFRSARSRDSSTRSTSAARKRSRRRARRCSSASRWPIRRSLRCRRCARGRSPNWSLAGVGADRALHLLEFDPTTGAIMPVSATATRCSRRARAAWASPAPATSSRSIRNLGWRLPVWASRRSSSVRGLLVAVPAGDSVWVWRGGSHASLQRLGGRSASCRPDTADAVRSHRRAWSFLRRDAQRMFALRDGRSTCATGRVGPTWDAARRRRSAGHSRRRWPDRSRRSLTSDWQLGGALDRQRASSGVSDAGKLFTVTSATGHVHAMSPVSDGDVPTIAPVGVPRMPHGV